MHSPPLSTALESCHTAHEYLLCNIFEWCFLYLWSQLLKPLLIFYSNRRSNRNEPVFHDMTSSCVTPKSVKDLTVCQQLSGHCEMSSWVSAVETTTGMFSCTKLLVIFRMSRCNDLVPLSIILAVCNQKCVQ